MSLPEYINVTKVISYHVPSMLIDIRDMKEIDPNLDIQEPTSVDEVLDFLEDWVYDDFGSLGGLIYTDENGEEL